MKIAIKKINKSNIIIGVIASFILISLITLFSHFNSVSKKVIVGSALNEVNRTAQILKIIGENYSHLGKKDGEYQSTMMITNYSENDTLSNKIATPAFQNMDITKEVGANESQINIYSKYPFPWRVERKLTDFQTRAWDNFMQNTTVNRSYYEVDEEKNILNYAVPNRMQREACINCHNNHPQTPRKNWKIGDIGGVISISMPLKNSLSVINEAKKKSMIIILILLVLTSILIFIILNRSKKRLAIIDKINKILFKIENGELPNKLNVDNNTKVGKVVKGVNLIIDYLNNVVKFAQDIGKGEFNSEYNLKGEKDMLGKSLIDMRNNLLRVSEMDKKRNFSIEGIAKFGEILRNNNDDLAVLSKNIILNLVNYLSVNQGGIFVINDDDNNPYMELVATYAYDKDKFADKKIELGEGLIGQAWKEGERIYLTDVPQSYMNITSGLGDAKPSSILIIPLKINEKIYGVIELASLRKFDDFEIDFVEKLSESIASTLSSVKVNIKTSSLLESAQRMSAQMQSQEEELRQNAEEMQATQEEMERTNIDLKNKNELMRVKEVEMKVNLEEAQEMSEEMIAQEEMLRTTSEEIQNAQEEMEIAQEKLTKKEASLRTIIDNSEDSIFSINTNYEITVINNKLLNKYKDSGMDLSEGVNILSLLPDDKKKFWKARYDRALAGEKFEIKDEGSTGKHLLVSHYPTFNENNEITGVAIISREV